MPAKLKKISSKSEFVVTIAIFNANLFPEDQIVGRNSIPPAANRWFLLFENLIFFTVAICDIDKIKDP